jgi:hypothetical protein
MIKMYLNKTHSKIRVGKQLSDNFLVHNSLKQSDVLKPLFFNLAIEYTIRKVQENQLELKIKGDISAVGLLMS